MDNKKEVALKVMCLELAIRLPAAQDSDKLVQNAKVIYDWLNA